MRLNWCLINMLTTYLVYIYIYVRISTYIYIATRNQRLADFFVNYKGWIILQTLNIRMWKFQTFSIRACIRQFNIFQWTLQTTKMCLNSYETFLVPNIRALTFQAFDIRVRIVHYYSKNTLNVINTCINTQTQKPVLHFAALSLRQRAAPHFRSILSPNFPL